MERPRPAQHQPDRHLTIPLAPDLAPSRTNFAAPTREPFSCAPTLGIIPPMTASMDMWTYWTPSAVCEGGPGAVDDTREKRVKN